MEIFVFGSNMAGIHGAGAAKHALEHHGAKLYHGGGLHGRSYAIPTKDWGIDTLPLSRIHHYVDEFIKFAEINAEHTYKVTAIGCGLAGYNPEDIAPLFKEAPSNCLMPPEWKGEKAMKNKKFWKY